MPLFYERGCQEQTFPYLADSLPLVSQPLFNIEALSLLQYRQYYRQNLFPYLAPPMRELLVSGTCPKCWKQVFGAEDTGAETRGNDFDREGE
jgi:hypothetical protein